MYGANYLHQGGDGVKRLENMLTEFMFVPQGGWTTFWEEGQTFCTLKAVQAAI